MNSYYLRKSIYKDNRLAAEIAYNLGISRKTLYKKLNRPALFTMAEIVVLKRILKLNMNDTIKIFAPFVAYRN